MKELYATISVILLTGSVIPYVFALWKKTAKPHAFSWLLWGLLQTVVFAAQLTSDAGTGSWGTGTAMVLNLMLGTYALKYGERHFTKSDWAVFISALCAIPLWVITKDPLWSVILVSTIDVVAFWPTVRKSWNKPHEEVAATFLVGGIGFAFSLLALENSDFVNYCYPAVVMAVNVVFVAMLFWRRKVLPR